MSQSDPHVLQALEPRRLLAANVDSNNVLQVTATEAADFVQVDESQNVVTVTINGGTPQKFKATILSGYNITPGGGNDIVVITGTLVGATVNGGLGNDRIVGGDGNETLYGAAGKDQIDGGAGNDKLNGNGGNDKLFGSFGADRIYGGAGNDYLDGGSSPDKLYGQAGADTLLGQSGNDNLFSNDATVDQVFGGSGTDTGIVDGIDIRGSVEQVAII